jgi:hypothetical protein
MLRHSFLFLSHCQYNNNNNNYAHIKFATYVPLYLMGELGRANTEAEITARIISSPTHTSFIIIILILANTEY